MNELLVGGICLIFICILCFAIDFEENGGFHKLKRKLGKTWDRIGEWLFDVGTAYYKFMLERERKKYKQYF